MNHAGSRNPRRGTRCPPIVPPTWSENGNITPAAAFNEYVDPEAADVVLTSGIPLTMVPMDVSTITLTFRPPNMAGLIK
jgi:inosine-uridine nucleoside N-ribohydrolase